MPTRNQLTEQPRQDIAIAIRESETLLSEYIAHRLLPVFRVGVSTGPIPKYTRPKQLMRVRRGKGMATSRSHMTAEDGATYICQEQSHEQTWDEKDDETLNGEADIEAAEAAAHVVLTAREKALADVLSDTSGDFSGQTTAAGGTWDNATVSSQGNPFNAMADAGEAVRLRIGRKPNTLTLGAGGLVALEKNDAVQNRIRAILGNTSPRGVVFPLDEELIKMVFGLEHVYIGNAMYDTADEGQTESLANIWPSTVAMLSYTSDTERRGPQLGRHFVWDQPLTIDPNASPVSVDGPDGLAGLLVEEYRDTRSREWVERAIVHDDQVILNSKAHQIITGISA